MNAVLLDTNTASALFDVPRDDHEKAHEFIRQLGTSRVYISCVTIAEIKYGYKVHTKVDNRRKLLIEREMKKYPVFDIEKHTADYYSEIKARLFAKHGLRDDKGKVKTKWPEDLLDKTTGKKLGIQENDLWMVAIAAEHNMPFVTADKMTRLKEITRETYPGFEFLNWRTGAVPS